MHRSLNFDYLTPSLLIIHTEVLKVNLNYIIITIIYVCMCMSILLCSVRKKDQACGQHKTSPSTHPQLDPPIIYTNTLLVLKSTDCCVTKSTIFLC